MIAIIEYGMGNVGSVQNMLRAIGSEAVVTRDPGEIAQADKLILPGVGAFDTGMRHLNEAGLVGVLKEQVIDSGKPVLGICLGMQLLTEGSEEGGLPGLGWIAGRSVRFRFDASRRDLKVPHMGWNQVRVSSDAPIVQGLPEDARFYFVHSYHVTCDSPADVAATTLYGYEFPSIVQRGHIAGTQFHPEKSHRFGMRVLQNFVERS